MYDLLARVLNRVSADGARGEFDSVIVAPSGGGSIGDQGLVEGSTGLVGGRVLLVTRAAHAFDTNALLGDIVVETMPGLISGGMLANVRSGAAVLRRLKRDGRLYVIGADVMDGLYNPSDSVARFEIARQAAKRGFHATLLPFSWNGAPRPSARRAAQLASREGVQIFARDPESHRRLLEIGVASVESADLVFNDHRLPTPERIDELYAVVPERRDRMVVVNVNGLVGKTPGLLDAYAETVRLLLGLGFGVVLLPHDLRAGVNDLDYCRIVAERLAGERYVGLITQRLRPAEIRGLCAEAEFVVSGRMHLAVMALMNGRPAVVLSTQGKVQGLLDNFGIGAYCVETGDAVAGALVERTRSMVGEIAQATHRVRAGLDRVQSLAARPFVEQKDRR